MSFACAFFPTTIINEMSLSRAATAAGLRQRLNEVSRQARFAIRAVRAIRSCSYARSPATGSALRPTR